MAVDVTKNINIICDPSAHIADLNEKIPVAFNNFIKSLKSNNMFLNPMVTSILTQLIGDVTKLGLPDLMGMLENQVDRSLSEIGTALDKIKGTLSIFLTMDAQFKLAMYMILIMALKSQLENRIKVLNKISDALTRVDRFLATWDYLLMNENEMNKLKKAEILTKNARGNMTRANMILESLQSHAGIPYDKALSNMKGVVKVLESKREIALPADIRRYWEDWWKVKQKALLKFSEDSVEILQSLPLEQATLNKIIGKWSSITLLVAGSLAFDSTNVVDTLTKSLRKYFGSTKLIPVNAAIRESAEEIRDLDATWESMEKYAKANQSLITKWLRTIEEVHTDMLGTIKERPNEVIVALKNAQFSMEANSIVTGMELCKLGPINVDTYDQLTKTFINLRKLIIKCTVYPEKGKHPAEDAVDLILNTYETIFTGFVSKGGSRKARVYLGNVKRQINNALVADTELLSLCNSMSFADNALMQAAMAAFNAVMGPINDVLGLLGDSRIASLLNSGLFSKALSSFLPRNPCEAKMAGEKPDTKIKSTMDANTYKLAKQKRDLFAASSGMYANPIKFECDESGIDWFGGD